MKRFIYLLIVAVSLTAFPPTSWADGQSPKTETETESALEQVELAIVRLKRELMDLEREYRFERNGAKVEDVPEMTRQYALTSMQINEELRQQEALKMQLVEQSVNTYLADEDH
ncbi:MAG: hypothetical protein ISP91_14305 [Pseudomonadales bacterium]|jgi:hypothetical protein|nr:hypothetical protein [Pseudomonadales bacterium]